MAVAMRKATNAAGNRYDVRQIAEFIEAEVLPLVEKNYHVTLTKDPEGRATMGQQFRRLGGAHHGVVSPGVVHRVITYSGTYVNQQWPFNPGRRRRLALSTVAMRIVRSTSRAVISDDVWLADRGRRPHHRRIGFAGVLRSASL